MEHYEPMKQAISAFLDRFQPKTEADIERLRNIQAGFAAGQTLESQYDNFIAIGDEDLLRAFYETVPDLHAQILAHPRCPEGLAPAMEEEPEASANPSADDIPYPLDPNKKHPLLSLDQEIDLDLKGLISFEASLPAGMIDGPEQAGCNRRIENLQRLFDRVPAVLHETDLTDNQNPLFYDLLLAKQRIASNLKIFTRLRISLANRFVKTEPEKDADPERSLWDETPSETNPEPENTEPEPEGPTEEELEEEAFAAFLAEEEARAAAEAKAAEKKAANEKRQQRLRQQAKEQEERSHQEQRQREEAARHADRVPDAPQTPSSPDPSAPPSGGGSVVPPYEYTTIPDSVVTPSQTYDEQAEVLRRQEQTRKESVLQESERKLEEHRTAQNENLQQYQDRMDRSYGYESFGKNHIDFSGKENHGSADERSIASDNQMSAPIPTAGENSTPVSHAESQGHPEDKPFYPYKQDIPKQDLDRREDPGYRTPVYTPEQPIHPETAQPHQPEPAIHVAQPEQRPVGPTYAEPTQPEQRPSDPTYAAPIKQAHTPFYDPQENPPVNRTSYDEQTEWNRKQKEYKDDVLTREHQSQAEAVRDRRDSAVHDYQAKMDQSYGYQSFGHGHIDFSGKDNHGGEPFQPYVYTPGGGVAPAHADVRSQPATNPSNPELYQMASETGKITPEMSRAMRDNLAELRKEYEASKGTPAFQEVSQRYQESRAAVMSITNDIRNNLISMEQDAVKATNTANVSRTYRPGRSDSFTAYQYTPTGVQGTSYEKGTASGGVIVHNTPGSAGKEVYSREKPMFVTKAYEESLARDAKLARTQLRDYMDPQPGSNPVPKLTPSELAAYRTSLDAYEGYRRAKADGFVKVTSAAGAINTPDQLAWAARQETYRQTVNQRRQSHENDAQLSPFDNTGGRRPNDFDHQNRNNSDDFRSNRNHDRRDDRDQNYNNNDHRDDWNRNNNDRQDGRNRNNNDNNNNDRRDRDRNNNNNDRKDRDRNNNNNDRKDRDRNNNNNDRKDRDRNNNNNDRKDRDRNNNNNDRKDRDRNNNNNDRKDRDRNNNKGDNKTPRPDPRGNHNWRNWNTHIKVAPFGSVFSINYNRGKYTTGEKGASAKLLNKETKLQRTSALRNMGSKLYRNYSSYVPEASTMAGRKLYTILQASNETGSQSIRTFEQGRYYGTAGAGLIIAQATKNVGNVKRFERHSARAEMHQYGFKRSLSNQEVARKFHSKVNEGRAAKKEIRRLYEREAGLSVSERRLLAEKIKSHNAMGKETAKWAGLHQARVKKKVQKEVLEELHRNRNGYGLVTDKALKKLQTQRRQIQQQRRDILKSQTERPALNKRISQLQKKGKGNLSKEELDELRELRKKLSKLSSDPRLKALDRKEQELLKLYKKKPDETSVGLKHIRLKDAEKLRNKILVEHAALEKGKFSQFHGIKTSVIKNNKQLMERQSEVAKIKVKKLLAKSRRTAGEEQELRQLLKLLRDNQEKIKAHATILNLRNVRDMKVEAIDKVRKALRKNKQRKRMGKMALVSFMIQPLQEGDNIGAQGLAKGISLGMNPYVRGLVQNSVDSSIRFTKFAARKIGKVTGLDKTLAPAIDKTKEIYAGARKIAHTPSELKKKAIKTAVDATKSAASHMTPQFVKTGAAAVRKKMSDLALKLQKSRLGKAYEAIVRNLSKMKAAIGTVAKAVAAVVGKVVLVILALILVAGLITVIGGAIGGAIPSFLVMGDETTDEGKIDLTPYAEVFNEELLAFKEKVIAAKTAMSYENITEICYGPADYNNIKEIISMTAVRMSQDLDMDENPDVEKYIRSIFNDSHIITTEESEPYSCSGCETRTVNVGHSSSCPEDCTTTHTELETYCPGKHVDLTITITTLVFDEIFTADTMANEDQNVIAGGLIADDFEITFYLPTGNKTASGTEPKADRTIAVDPSVIPLGTHVIINGKEYIAEDTGGAVNGHIIDIFVEKESDIPSEGRLKNVSVYYADYEGEGMLSSEEWNGWVEENRIWAKTIYSAPWDDLYYGLDAVGAYIDGTWTDYDWSTFEYSDESNLTQAQQRVAHIAKNSGSFGIAANAGYCQQWVRLVYSAAGYGGGNAASANDAGAQWLVSKDWSNIPVGAAVYGYSSSVYGHVGIYVGDGKVYHNVGGVDVDSLEEWVSKYKGYGWGWQGGHDLTSSS